MIGGVIYITTNNINGKKYIGRKKYKKGWEDYLGSSKLLLDDISKYGTSSFTREIIEVCDTSHELQQRERYWHEYYNVKADTNFYNIVYANEGFDTSGARFTYSDEALDTIWSKDRRDKQRKWMLDKSNNPNYREDISKAKSDRMKKNNPSFRDDVKQKLSDIKSVPFSLEYEGKIYNFKNNKEAVIIFGNAAISAKKNGYKKNNPYKGLKLVDCKAIC